MTTPDFLWSMSHEELLGSFSRQFVFVNLAPQTSIPSREEIAQTMRTDPVMATTLALTRYAGIHETRHFHDAFGTTAGLTAFMLHFQSLLEFAAMRRDLAIAGIATPPPPLKEHYYRQNCPDSLKHFIRRQVLLDRAIALTCGEVAPFFAHTTEHWDVPIVQLTNSRPEDVNSELGIAPASAFCFPQALALRDEAGRERKATRYIPISFATLSEANAQMLQRELAFAEFGQAMRQSIVSSTQTLSRTSVRLSQLDAMPVPYDTIDFLLARIARSGGRNADIHPNTIFRVTEHAMNATHFIESGNRAVVVFNTPGQTLSRLIETQLTPERLNGPATDLGSFDVPLALPDLLTEIDRLPDWRDVEEDGSLESPLRMVYSYVMREVAKPLLSRKLDPAFVRKYTTLSGYMELLPELPKPFVIGRPDHLQVDLETKNKTRLLSAWLKYCFVVDILRHSFDGPGIALCPRKHGFLSGWPHLNLSFGARECRELIDRTVCGEWALGQGRTLPSCVFSNTLHGMGFPAQTAPNVDATRPVTL